MIHTIDNFDVNNTTRIKNANKYAFLIRMRGIVYIMQFIIRSKLASRYARNALVLYIALVLYMQQTYISLSNRSMQWRQYTGAVSKQNCPIKACYESILSKIIHMESE